LWIIISFVFLFLQFEFVLKWSCNLFCGKSQCSIQVLHLLSMRITIPMSAMTPRHSSIELFLRFYHLPIFIYWFSVIILF
jgi:hypothetical protein